MHMGLLTKHGTLEACLAAFEAVQPALEHGLRPGVVTCCLTRWRSWLSGCSSLRELSKAMQYMTDLVQKLAA